jgi:hypothetical protein
MTSPLERAARALYQSAPHDFDPNQMGEDATWPDLVPQARAVIAAIREPSEGMKLDGHIALMDQFGIEGYKVPKGAEWSAWRAMIDAALTEV